MLDLEHELAALVDALDREEIEYALCSGPVEGARMKSVDYSERAITQRIRQVSQLRKLCLSLGKAKPVRPPDPPRR